MNFFNFGCVYLSVFVPKIDIQNAKWQKKCVAFSSRFTTHY